MKTKGLTSYGSLEKWRVLVKGELPDYGHSIYLSLKFRVYLPNRQTVNYPAAELRGIENQKLTVLGADA
jgi:hypothetical protein